ncbi:hypothetical protein LBK6_15745 [Leptospira borgpetersenii serovar Hardjo]|nr:hypothetical protein LBK6_15745 [Leptospira borgpetersenii serovar Hardjo]AYR09857.1 hypothetical protein D1609_17000 [Leptospira borgpetersenii serovar Hardjo-bovis]AMX62946.1 hypothetical protein LBK9_15660 [Leptospira borgpetersenii serovar Hardjo]AMX66189.1 hypothetical protein LBK30_15660 [Leptospira borgpetersenii serovar Hardjo]AMX69421.1 hypothetical protein LBHA_15625 [Leptospira borgpetersenii serovar Hardjo]
MIIGIFFRRTQNLFPKAGVLDREFTPAVPLVTYFQRNSYLNDNISIVETIPRFLSTAKHSPSFPNAETNTVYTYSKSDLCKSRF